jgi:hypothetical protein
LSLNPRIHIELITLLVELLRIDSSAFAKDL